MACEPCSSGSGTNINGSLNNCGCPGDCGFDAGNVIYSGPNLSCSNIETGDLLDTIISKLDTAVCTATGDLSSFNVYCLDDSGAITTQQQFVETISEFVCTLRTDLNTFTGTTFPAYQTTVNDRFVAIEVPGITCTSAGVVPTDNIQTVLTKYCTKFSNIDFSIDLSGVNWNQCFVVSPEPTTVKEAFDVVTSQICQLQTQINGGGGGALPTFNNVGSCLPTPVTATDSLVSTVNKIKARLCQSPTFDINALTWTCVSKPSTTTTDLQAAFQAILSKLDTLSQSMPTFNSGQFSISNVDNSNLCLGKSVSISAGASTDKFVAINSSDLSPSYLINKLTAGTNITLDTTTTPGTMIINSTAGAIADEKVKAFSADPTGGFLDQKLEPGSSSNGVSISLSNNLGNNKVSISANVDMNALVLAIISAVSDSTELYNLWCNLNASCPSPCNPPSNITVVYNDTTTTTTTTSSTTTTTTTT